MESGRTSQSSNRLRSLQIRAPQQLTLRPTWPDPAAWGLMLVDLAHHVALAYEREGRDRDEVIRRIREAFDAEWAHPTDVPKTLEPDE